MNPKEETTPQKIKTHNISLSNSEKLSLISNLSTMLSAGIPLLETVESLLEDSKGNQKKLLEVLKEDLIQGKHIYFTFSKFPRIFDRVSANIIKASEEAGTLDVTLKDLRLTIKKEIEFNDRIKSALIYPVFIIIVFFGVLTMILVVVVPKISLVFSRLKVELPLPTRILITMSNILLEYTLPVIIIIALLLVGGFFIIKRQKTLILNMFFALPLISTLALQIDLTRFTRSLYLLLNAGIPITTALELTGQVVMKKDVIKAVAHVKDVISSGKKVSDGFKDNRKVFPGILIRITQAGEKSGGLDKAMQDVAEFLDYQVSGTLRTVTALIEPLLLVVVGILIGGMMLAIIAPIYGLIGQVGAR